MSRYPFFKVFEKILSSLYHASKKGLRFPFEYYISCLTCCVPTPPRSRFKVSLQLTSEFKAIEIEQPEQNRLPLLDVHFVLLPRLLSLKNAVKVLNGILIGFSVVFVCERVEKLTQVAESIMALMFPFIYELVYIPIVPESMVGFLSAPMQFIAGIDKVLEAQAMGEVETDTMMVDLDKDRVEIQEQTEGKMPSKRDFVELPRSEVEILCSCIGDAWKSMKGRKKEEKSDEEFREANAQAINTIRKGFLNMFISMFKTYQDFIVNDTDNSFDKSRFIKALKSEYRPFMKQFLDTQIFQQFIEKKMFPQSNDDITRNRYFDESISSKAKAVIPPIKVADAFYK